MQRQGTRRALPASCQTQADILSMQGEQRMPARHDVCIANLYAFCTHIVPAESVPAAITAGSAGVTELGPNREVKRQRRQV